MFAWADLAVVGIAFDISGAVTLAWSLWGKTAWRIRQEIPRTIHVSVTYDETEIPFPQGLARSLARQAAEARLGVTLLVGGFAAQAVYYFFPHVGTLATWPARGIAFGLALAAPTTAALGMKRYVPKVERRIYMEVESGERRVWTTARRLVELGVTLPQLQRGRSSGSGE